MDRIHDEKYNPCPSIIWLIIDTRGAKEYCQVLAADLSIQPHLET